MNILFYETEMHEKSIFSDGVDAFDKEISGSFFSRFLNLMLGKPCVRLNTCNQKTTLRFPCVDLNPIIDSINLLVKGYTLKGSNSTIFNFGPSFNGFNS